MVTRNLYPARLIKVIITLIFFLILAPITISGQEPVYGYYYRVYFRDKGSINPNDFSLSDLVSARAIERRQKAGISSADYSDLPVNEAYLDQVSSMSFNLHCKSRWMNSAVFKAFSPVDLNSFLNLPFVKDVKLVKHPAGKNAGTDKLSFTTYADNLPPYDRPLSMLNGIAVQNSGFYGNGILIAVLDGGFLNADNISSLEGLRNRNGIKGTYDFVTNKKLVYDYHNHGTAVLSVLAGRFPGLISGTAPGADYWLFRTEDAETEYPVEEDFWVAGAEIADSIGVDIISSSLGYVSFDDPLMDYKYSDMDGNSAFITKAADIGASKGILIVCSAGNERSGTWKYIIAPSDGDSVLAVGAVEGNNLIASFSSAGPSFDRRIKPDVVAQGVSVPVQVQTSSISRSNGTSFSCPVISGLSACIMQAVPNATGYDIISAIHEASDRYLSPDSLYGYGIPDMAKLIVKLQDKLAINTLSGSVVSPNPFMDILTVTFREVPQSVRIEIFSANGRLIIEKNYRNFISRSLVIPGLENINDGLYFIRLTTPGGTFIHKILKLTR